MEKSIRSTISFGSLILFIVLSIRTVVISLKISEISPFQEGVTLRDRLIPPLVGESKVLPENTTDKNNVREPDGRFNRVPIFYVPPTSQQRTSSIHCVGENFRSDAWHYRSCEIQHFCFNVTSHTFFVFASPEQLQIEQAILRRNDTYYGSISTRLNISAALKSVTSNLLNNKKDSSWSWQPLIQPPPSEGYYELSPEVVWTPIHTLNDNAINPGHLLWDYFLPIYTLLSMFGYENNSTTPLVTDQNRYCTSGRKNSCFKMVSKFIPLLGVTPGSYSNTITSIDFNTWGIYGGKSKIVCARQALVGIGMLSDHGQNKHGQAATDYERMRNMGRGAELYRFRNFMLRNMGIGTDDDAVILKAPYHILVSQNSSNSPRRQKSFEKQIEALEQKFSSHHTVVKPLVLTDLSLEEQLQVLSQSKVYIGVMGGGAAFASFLPRGSTVVLFFDDVHDWVKSSTTAASRPVMMDWDFFNNAAYLSVHWFPLSTMDSEEDIDLLVNTIRIDLKAQIQ